MWGWPSTAAGDRDCLAGHGAAAAHAQSDLVGKWTGQFVGVQIEMPSERGPFSQQRDDNKGTPRFHTSAACQTVCAAQVETGLQGIERKNVAPGPSLTLAHRRP